MRSASYSRSVYGQDQPLRRRATSLALAILFVALIILMLLRLGILVPPLIEKTPVPNSFSLEPANSTAANRSESRAQQKTTRKSSAAAPAKASKTVPTPVTPVPPVKPQPSLLNMSKDEFAATDISKLGHSGGGDQDGEGTSGSGKGHDSGTSYGPGAGPGGVQIYNVAWYREPTQAEMSTYLPHNGVSGWGEVACRMIDHYHVENCRELAEYPRGSGLARAVRLASWQFLVRPPRKGDQVMLGTWVRIHYALTYRGSTDREASDRSPRDGTAGESGGGYHVPSDEGSGGYHLPAEGSAGNSTTYGPH